MPNEGKIGGKVQPWNKVHLPCRATLVVAGYGMAEDQRTCPRLLLPALRRFITSGYIYVR